MVYISVIEFEIGVPVRKFEYGVILDYNEFLYKIIRTSAFRRGSYYSFVAQGLRVCSNFGGRGKQPFPSYFLWLLYL